MAMLFAINFFKSGEIDERRDWEKDRERLAALKSLWTGPTILWKAIYHFIIRSKYFLEYRIYFTLQKIIHQILCMHKSIDTLKCTW